MSDELENKDNPGETGDNVDNVDNAPGPDELADVKAQLETERAALAEARATLTDKDAAIASLQTQLGEVQSGFDAQAGLMAKFQEDTAAATGKYLEAVRSLNAAIPADVITGDTIEDIDASVAHAQAIADAVRQTLADEAKKAKVPAGAPTRAINLDGLTAKEKIALGLSQQKGGNA